LQAKAEGDARFVVAGNASAYLLCTMKYKSLPAGFVVPAQPVKASKSPAHVERSYASRQTASKRIVAAWVEKKD
jgi:hypothetical protein